MALLTAAKTNLQRLALVRLIVITGELAATIYAFGWLRAPLHYTWLFAVICVYAAVTIFTFWRLGRPWPVTDAEFFAQLLFDVGSLSALLYASGGATNPFVSYYLVPLSIAAAVLPWRYTASLALICVAAYSALLFIYVPLPCLRPRWANITITPRAHDQSAYLRHVVQFRLVCRADHLCRRAHGEYAARTAARIESAPRTGIAQRTIAGGGDAGRRHRA